MTYHDAFYGLRRDLRAVYDDGEAGTIVKHYLNDVTGMSYSQGLGIRGEALSSAVADRIRGDRADLAAGRPLQYVLGHTDFFGRKYAVDERVLIPRPETEGLVQWVLEDGVVTGGQVLDAGTGSGCIAVSLALALPSVRVIAADISLDALGVAAENAAALGAAVRTLPFDMLRQDAWKELPVLNVIVSNPPYIPATQREALDKNVRDYEPHIALFAPDNDPLIFYRALAAGGQACLGPGGRVYCEFQTDLADPTAAVFTSAGYAVDVRRDSYDCWRMLRATLPQ